MIRSLGLMNPPTMADESPSHDATLQEVKQEPEEETVAATPPGVSPSQPAPEAATVTGSGNGVGGPAHETRPSLSRKRRPAVPHGQEGYARKLRRIKLVIKNTIFVNGAICDEVLRTEEKLSRAKEERRFLLRKLLQYQSVTDSLGAAVKAESHTAGKQSKASQDHSASEPSMKPNKSVKRKSPGSALSSTSSAGSQLASSTSLPPSSSSSPLPSSGLTATGLALLPGTEGGKKKQTQAGKDGPGGTPSVKPKRGKGVNKRVIPPLMLDSQGRPVFPMVLGDITLHSIGEIVIDRASFHSPESIFPAGYCTSRIYGSLHKLDSSCLWTCKISESDDGTAPVCEVAAEDSSDIVFRASNPTDCHSQLVRAFNKSRGIPLVASETSGLDFFGLSHPVIQNLVQSCPGARKCSRYKWVKFEINKAESNDNMAVGTTDPAVGLEAFRAQLIAMGLKPSGKLSQLEQSTNLRSLLTKGQSGVTH